MSIVHLAVFAEAATALYGWAGWSISYYDFTAHKTQEVSVHVGSVKTQQQSQIYWLRETDTKKDTVRWITTDQCPVAKSIIYSLNRLKAPSPSVPGSTKKAPRIYPMDTPRYTIWVPVRFDDRTTASLKIAGASSPHIVAWSGQARSKLEPCWRAEKPEFVTD